MDVDKLNKTLCSFLSHYGYKNIEHNDAYIMAEGELPVCLVAHMDTVFKDPPLPENFMYDSEQKILWSYYGAGFDDRAGIYAILEIIKAGFRPSVIFTNYEEIGGGGADELLIKYQKCPFKYCNMLIELDRANKKDAVYYDCANEDFADYIESFGFEISWGTFTDVRFIAPVWGIAAVNLSIGYEDEHTISERLHCDWCDATIEKVKLILSDEDMIAYPYIQKSNYRKMFIEDKTKCLFCGGSDDLMTTVDGVTCCKYCYNMYYAIAMG